MYVIAVSALQRTPQVNILTGIASQRMNLKQSFLYYDSWWHLEIMTGMLGRGI